MFAKQGRAINRKPSLAAILHGMAATGLLYNLPPISPVKYERPLNADLVNIGGDMWRAVKIYDEEQASE